MKLIGIVWIAAVLWCELSAGQIATNAIPATLGQLNSWYAEPPPGKNGALFLLKAMSQIQISDAERKSTNVPWVGRAKLPRPRQPIPEAMRAAIREIVRRNDTALRQLNDCRGFSENRYPVDFEKGAYVSVSHVDKIRQTAEFLYVCVLFYADSDEPEEALSTTMVSFDLANSLKMEPLMYSQVWRGGCIFRASKGLVQLLNRSKLSADALSQLETRLRDLEREEAQGIGFSRALVGERLLSDYNYDLPVARHIRVVTNMLSGSIGTLKADAVSIPAPDHFPREGDRKSVKETFSRLSECWSYSYPQRLKLVNELRFSREYSFRSRNYLGSIQALFDGAVMARGEAQCLAILRLARTAVALERFRMEQGGSFPESLSELVPQYLEQVPLDPFDGRPLRYSSTGLSFHLFSVVPPLASEPVTDRLFTFDVDH